jgi:hypothetical protein
MKKVKILTSAMTVCILLNACNNSKTENKSDATPPTEQVTPPTAEATPSEKIPEEKATVEDEEATTKKFLGSWIGVSNQYLTMKIWKKDNQINVKPGGYCYDNKVHTATLDGGRLLIGEGESQLIISYSEENKNIVEGSNEFKQQ